MALYLIGDVQGCDAALGRLFDRIDFSPSRDCAYLLGDMVNRGPASLAVLRRLQAMGDSAQCILGNHDLSLLALSQGARRAHRLDTLDDILNAPDRGVLLDWLRTQPMARFEHGVLMVHAGVLPSWDAEQTLALAAEVEAELSGPQWPEFMRNLFGAQPDAWSEGLGGFDRLRVIVNALTRIRFCSEDGRMDMKRTGGPSDAPPGYRPWFEMPERRSSETCIAFGHWSTLGVMRRTNLMSLDSGCVWGGPLSALRLASADGHEELFQVPCGQKQTPGE